jgi:hypothetical protein
LEAARVLSYRKKFRGAKKLLQSLSTDIECRLEHLLKAKLRALSVEALRSKRDNLDEGDQVQLYIDLGDLADLHGNLGRCAEELDEPEQAQLGYRFAAAVLVQRSSLWIPYHLTAANIGIWLEDLARYNPDMYDIAIDANNRQFQDAYDYYRENPKDCSALMNMAWAVAGNVSCLAGKLRSRREHWTAPKGTNRSRRVPNRRPTCFSSFQRNSGK